MALDLDLILFFVCAIPGLLLELGNQISKVSTSRSDPQFKSKDRGTFQYIWIIVISSMGLSIHYVRVGYGSKIFTDVISRCAVSLPISMCLIVLGRQLRQQAIKQLGQWFTMTVCINDQQELIETGWYARMRHPSYTGVVMIFIGLGLLVNNWLGLVGTVIPPLLIFLYRIHVEEQELRAHFGSAYDEYAQKVPAKLVPYVY